MVRFSREGNSMFFINNLLYFGNKQYEKTPVLLINKNKKPTNLCFFMHLEF